MVSILSIIVHSTIIMLNCALRTEVDMPPTLKTHYALIGNVNCYHNTSPFKENITISKSKIIPTLKVDNLPIEPK